MELATNIDDLNNESDVEQKVIYPILTAPNPMGLGYKPCDFNTKPDIRHIVIDKGNSKKLYYPDYVVELQGLPLFIIEAKTPGENLAEATREARLYATELNAIFPTDINPCSLLLVSDGLHFNLSKWDSDDTIVGFDFKDIDPSNIKYSEFLSYVNKKALTKLKDGIHNKIRAKSIYVKPTNMLGGRAVQNEELKQNTFGLTLALDYRHIFNPSSKEDRKNIVKNAYVVSKKRQKHVSPIDKLIRAAATPSFSDAKSIDDQSKPIELIDKLQNKSKLNHEIILLIGNVGSGKSTFIDYLIEVGLPDDLKSDTIWAIIDLNSAPLAKDRIYDWIKKAILIEIQSHYTELDFDELDTLQKIYSVELNRIKKGPGALFKDNKDKLNELLAQELYRLQNDINCTLNAYIRYFCAERKKQLIIVLDNADKRNRDEQLLMFDVAKWIKSECNCIVFLPLRDTTYDHHRKEPPLDTIVKDLVFRIDPPVFMDVLYKRAKYALDKMKTDGNEVFHYVLENGWSVEYPLSDQGMYLACILRSLFHNDVFFRRLISGIAGRDIRKGLEIFLDFCKSGHINEAEIFKMRKFKGNHILQKHIVTRVLLRGNRRYYHDSNTYIKNIFHSEPKDIIPDPFARLSILTWLAKYYRVVGPNNIKGYHKLCSLIKGLMPLGHNEDRLVEEVLQLIKAGCIITESQKSDTVELEELISITACGFVHLSLMKNINYLSSCAEDVWFKNQAIATNILERISGVKGDGHYTLKTDIENSEDLVTYLEDYTSFIISRPDSYLNEECYHERYSFDEIKTNIANFKKMMPQERDKKTILEEYPIGSTFEGEIVSIQKYGLFVEIGLNATGLVHISQFDTEKKLILENYENGDEITVEILRYNDLHKRLLDSSNKCNLS